MKTNIFYIEIILMILTFSIISCEKEKEDFTGTYGTFIDSRDGNSYNWVGIGHQIWMAENLNYFTEHGSSVPSAWYDSSYADYADTYGRLYRAYKACNVCPYGWHLPEDNEWQELINYLGGESVAGGKMKETGTFHWKSPNIGATNSSGFTALPGGGCYGTGNFSGMGWYACFWSSTKVGGSLWYRSLHYNDDDVDRDRRGDPPGEACSIRCVRD